MLAMIVLLVVYALRWSAWREAERAARLAAGEREAA